MSGEPFRPDGFDVALRDDGLYVKLAFERDDGETVDVEIPRQQLPLLLAALQKKVAPGQIVPIDPASLQIGRTYQTQGVSILKTPDGGARLTAFVELVDQGRTVTLPLSMSPADVTYVVQQLSKDAT